MKTSYGKLAWLALLLLLAALLLLPVRTLQRDDLIFEPSRLRMGIGDQYTVRCALSSENMKQSLRFISDDPHVARIDADGTVYALDAGETFITAEASGGARARLDVSVVGTPLGELTLNASELHIHKGHFSGLEVIYNNEVSDTRVQWLSSDEKIVRVNKYGRVEGVGGGMATVTALAPNGRSASAKVYVDVEATKLSIVPSGLTLGAGASVPLRIALLPVDSTDSVRRWVSSNPEVLTVSEDGVLQAHGAGSAYVTVITEGGLTSGMDVRVDPAPRDIQINPGSARLERGDELQLQLVLMNEDGTRNANSKHLTTWSSDDESIASVDANGCVRAIGRGECTITASADGMSASCTIDVHHSVREITPKFKQIELTREQSKGLLRLEWTLAPEDAEDKQLSFSSSDERIASVDAQGIVRFSGAAGEVSITATAGNGAQASVSIHITQ